MSSRKKDRRAIRAAIVRAAARRRRATVKELFIRAMPGVLVEVDLNKIPDEVVKLAREILRGRHRAHPPPRVIRERYYRAAPYLSTY